MLVICGMGKKKKNKLRFKKVSIYVALVIISFIIINYFLIFNHQRNDAIIMPTSQIISKRKWINVNLDMIYYKKYDTSIIYLPFKAKIDKWGNLYVLDLKLNSVIKFSSLGKFIKKFGYGKGRGPGEFLNPRDFSIDSMGKVYINDESLSIIAVFDSTSKLEKIIHLKNSGRLDKFVVFGQQEYFMKTLNVGSFFKILDKNGNLIKTFGDNFLSSQKSHALPLDVFLCSGNDKFYGTFVMGGYIFAYDTVGNLLFYRNTIDRINFPKFYYESNDKSSTTYSDRKAQIVNWDISYSHYGNKGIIYVHPYYTSRKLHALVIDAYEAKKGDYMYSFKIKRPSRKHGITSCIIHDNYLYLVGEGATTILIKYKIKLTKN